MVLITYARRIRRVCTNAQSRQTFHCSQGSRKRRRPRFKPLASPAAYEFMGGSRGGVGVWTPFVKSQKNIGFLSNTGLNPLENHKATKLAFNVGHHRPASETPLKWRFAEMAFRWRADDGPLIVVLGSSLLN